MDKNKRTLFGLMLSSFIVNLGFGAIMPFLSIYSSLFFYPIDLGFIIIREVTQIGLLTSAMMISRAFLAPFYGRMSDKEGRKAIIVVGLGLYVILTFGFGLATSFYALFVVRFVQGIASALVWPVAESAVVDVSKEEERGRNLGWFMMSMTLGWSLGPFLSTVLIWFAKLFVSSQIKAFQFTFFMMGGLSFIGFMIFNILVIDPKTNKARMSAKEIWTAVVLVIKTTFNISNLGIPSFLKPSFWKERTVSLRAVFIMAFSNGFGFAMVFPIFSLFFYQFYNLSEEFIGTIFGIVGLIGVVFNPIGGWVSDRTNKKVVVLFTGLISGILMGFAGFQFSIMLIIGLFTARQIVQQMNMPSFRALQADLVEPEKRGLEFGNVQMFFNTGSILGPILGGILYDKFSEQEFTFMGLQAFGVEYLFLITSSLAIIATIVLIIFVKKRDFVVNKLKENKEEYSFIAKE
ncbi:MAG: MFS transporter [Candidatus Heimdallarchaeum aukensis]|uniref:MFS transporter n=1 Tax=Candidatus Heimdallarchaeum aukensis TaxID=2876573 RepID=A0A9Y1BL74_9ARCH|nr:MAG: MFS transporter [Candidatus Heimdallarchaeum aukensis]